MSQLRRNLLVSLSSAALLLGSCGEASLGPKREAGESLGISSAGSGLPTIQGIGPGCRPQQCVWLRAKNVGANAFVEIRRRKNGPSEITLSGNSITMDAESSPALITFRVPPTFQAKFGREGIWVSVGDSSASAPRLVKAQRPEIVVGAGCDPQECIWIRAKNIEANSYVHLRTSAGGAPITIERSALQIDFEANPAVIRFRVPEYLIEPFQTNGLYVAVANPGAMNWSSLALAKAMAPSNPAEEFKFRDANNVIQTAIIRRPNITESLLIRIRSAKPCSKWLTG